jgi:hypothetical protein
MRRSLPNISPNAYELSRPSISFCRPLTANSWSVPLCLASAPLDENVIPPDLVQHAKDAHTAIDGGEQIIRQTSIDCYSIYTETHRRRRHATDFSYEVQTVHSGGPTSYQIRRTFSNQGGDGTVPASSAVASQAAAPKPVFNVVHSALTRDSKVCAYLHTIL